MLRKPLELQERSRILKLRAKGMSIVAISKELHRSKRTVSAFIKDPVNYLKSMKNGSTPNSNSNVPYNKLSGETPKKKSPAASDAAEKSTTNSTNSPEVANKKKSPKRVSLEQRCVINFLTKKGWNAMAIHDDMKHVYKTSAPSLNGIEYWVKECKTNPSINFDKMAKGKTVKAKITGKADKIWVVRKTIQKAKTNITKATAAMTKKKENGNGNGNGNNKEKDKNDKNTTNKNLITLKLFDNNSVKNKTSL